MRLLLFTDLHGSKSALDQVVDKARAADAIVFAGDFNHHASDIEDLMVRLHETNKPCFIIHGNWDQPDLLKKVCDKYDNLMFLHRGVIEHEGVLFIGHGGGGFSREDRDFERLWKKFLRKQIKPQDKIVLITHAPPYGTKVDSLYGEPRGNKTYRNFLEEHQPLLHVCGHFHENFGKVDKVKKTTVINPGPTGMYADIN